MRLRGNKFILTQGKVLGNHIPIPSSQITWDVLKGGVVEMRKLLACGRCTAHASWTRGKTRWMVELRAAFPS